ncbi:MAG: hypothetical protein J6W00_06445 [Lentisphaeria bacterium]|nr:hypothetical protein [Lentisphaeria bacterium]
MHCTRGFIKKMLKWSRATAYRIDPILEKVPKLIPAGDCGVLARDVRKTTIVRSRTFWEESFCDESDEVRVGPS